MKPTNNSDSDIQNNVNNNADKVDQIVNVIKFQLDEEGHLLDHTVWSPKVAQQLADTIEVTLTERHYQILSKVRDFFIQYQHPPATRPLIKYLQQQLPEHNITNQELQLLFNTGLVARHVNRVAGLPKPANCL